MKQSKSSLPNHKKKASKNIKAQPHQQATPYQQHPLQTTVSLLQKDIHRLQNTIHFYRSQVQELEQLNLELYQQLQESKIQEQSCRRSYIIQYDIVQHKNKELCQIIGQLQRSLRESKDMEGSLSRRCEEMQGRECQLMERMRQAQMSAQKYKLKLMESQKYWISRIQIVIGQKELDHEKAMKMKEGEHRLAWEMLHCEVALKDKTIRQKTQQIYKLISHIRGEG